jgi:hypothetical protein
MSDVQCMARKFCGVKSFEKSSRELQFKQCLPKIQNKIVTIWKLYLFMFVSHRDNEWTV